MPRSRTRARIRAARQAAGLIPHQSEWSPGLIGHLLRKIWKRSAAWEDYRIRVHGDVDRQERRRAIVATMNKWGNSLPRE